MRSLHTDIGAWPPGAWRCRFCPFRRSNSALRLSAGLAVVLKRAAVTVRAGERAVLPCPGLTDSSAPGGYSAYIINQLAWRCPAAKKGCPAADEQVSSQWATRGERQCMAGYADARESSMVASHVIPMYLYYIYVSDVTISVLELSDIRENAFKHTEQT